VGIENNVGIGGLFFRRFGWRRAVGGCAWQYLGRD